MRPWLDDYLAQGKFNRMTSLYSSQGLFLSSLNQHGQNKNSAPEWWVGVHVHVPVAVEGISFFGCWGRSHEVGCPGLACKRAWNSYADHAASNVIPAVTLWTFTNLGLLPDCLSGFYFGFGKIILSQEKRGKSASGLMTRDRGNFC